MYCPHLKNKSFKHIFSKANVLQLNLKSINPQEENQHENSKKAVRIKLKNILCLPWKERFLDVKESFKRMISKDSKHEHKAFPVCVLALFSATGIAMQCCLCINVRAKDISIKIEEEVEMLSKLLS